MDKLIITVTVDCSISYPRHRFMPQIEDVNAVAEQYVGAVNAGASLVHHHGIHYMESEMQPDGRKLSRVDVDGWRRLTEKIRERVDPVMQFGIASARLPEKIALMALKPDMMSYAFNVHDERFQPDLEFPAMDMYAIHTRDEIEEFRRVALEHGIKPEVESFYTGAFWNIEYIRNLGLLTDPVWTTIFLGWPGGAWTPPTQDSLLYLLRYLPARTNWNLSVMDPKTQWNLMAVAIGLGGHVRVGWEDNPYLPDGTPARANAELVENVVAMARTVGREIASPEEARRIIGVREYLTLPGAPIVS